MSFANASLIFITLTFRENYIIMTLNRDLLEFINLFCNNSNSAAGAKETDINGKQLYEGVDFCQRLNTPFLPPQL